MLIFRRLSIVAAFIILVGSYFAMGLLADNEDVKKSRTKSIREVSVFKAKNSSHQYKVNGTGKISSPDKIELFAEVTGVFSYSQKPFKNGSNYSNGEILLRIDDSERKLTIQSQKSALLTTLTQNLADLKLDFPDNFKSWESYISSFDVTRSIKPFPPTKSKEEKYFITSRGLINQYYAIRSAEAQLAKHIIRAPFDGTLTEVLVNKGALVRQGQKIGTFINTKDLEVELEIPLEEYTYIAIGNTARLIVKGDTLNGVVIRKGAEVDETTQTAKVFVGVSSDKLLVGQFASVEIKTNRVVNGVKLLQKLVNNDLTIFGVEKKKEQQSLKKYPIKVLTKYEDTVVVKGVEEGMLLLNQSFSDAFDGMPVDPVF